MNSRSNKISEKFETIPASLITFYLVVIFLVIIVLDLSQQGSFKGVDEGNVIGTGNVNQEIFEKESSEKTRNIGLWILSIVGIVIGILIIGFVIKIWKNEKRR